MPFHHHCPDSGSTQTLMNPGACRVCNQTFSTNDNFLLTCQTCARLFHHRCLHPPVSDEVMYEMWRRFVRSGGKEKMQWMCTRCTRRKGPASIGMQQGSSTNPLVVDLDEEPEEIIDLTTSPAARTSTTAPLQAFRAQTEETIIDISESPPPQPTIDLTLDDDSLEITSLPLLPEPSLPEYLVHPTGPSALLASITDGGSISAPPAKPISQKPDAREETQALTPGPAPAGFDEEPSRSPSLLVDEEEQKPLALLFEEKLKVSTDSRGGPAWFNERLEASEYLAKWVRLVEKQNREKPLSRRKPATTQFMGGHGKTATGFTLIGGQLVA